MFFHNLKTSLFGKGRCFLRLQLILGSLKLIFAPLPDLHKKEPDLTLEAADIGSLDVLDDGVHHVHELLLAVFLLESVIQKFTYRDGALLLFKEVHDQLSVLDVIGAELPEMVAQLVLILLWVALQVKELLQLLLNLALGHWHDSPRKILNKMVSN